MLVQSTKAGNALQKQVNEAWEELEMKTIGGLTGVEVEQFNNLPDESDESPGSLGLRIPPESS